jgi:hypothetical protein
VAKRWERTVKSVEGKQKITDSMKRNLDRCGEIQEGQEGEKDAKTREWIGKSKMKTIY